MGVSERVRSVEAWLTPGRVKAVAFVFLGVNLVTTAVWLLTSRAGLDRFGQPVGGDFVLFHAAARLTLEGRALAAFSPDAFLAAQRALVPGTPAGLYWCYPPPFQLLLAPLGSLPFGAALALWTAAGVGLLLLTVRGIVRHRLAALLVLASPVAWVAAWQGQTGLFVAAALAFGLFQLDRRPWAAGAVLGLLVCKPQYAVLAPLLLIGTGRWRSVLAAAGSVAVLSALSLLAFGPELWRAFLSQLPAVGDGVTAGTLPWAKIPSLYNALLRLGAPPGAALALHALMACGVAGGTLLAWRRPGPLGPKAGLAALAAVIVTPYGFNYDLVVLVLPLAAAAERRMRGPLPTGALLALAPLAFLPSLMVSAAGALHVQIAPAVLLLGYWGMWRVCAATAQVRGARRSRQASPSSSGTEPAPALAP